MVIKLCHFDVVVSEGSGAKTFYENVFNWHIEESDSAFSIIKTKDENGIPDRSIGSIWVPDKNQEVRNILLPYFEVTDIGAVVTAINGESGAKMLVQPMDYGGHGGGTIAVFQGVCGEIVGLHQHST